MSDNKKYYYIKLKDNYFDQDNVKILESVPNGHIYSLIIVKLYLKATKYGGQLKMTDSIPYDPTKVDILANVLHHDVAHVKESIKVAGDLGIITILESGEMWMTEIQNFIGLSSSEADRKREYRRDLKSKNQVKFGQMSGHLSDVRPPEIELELEKEKKDLPDSDESGTHEFYLTKRKRRLKGKRLIKFNEFWEAFNYKKGKADAADAWLDIPTLTESLVKCIIDAAKIEAKNRQSLVDKGSTPKWGQGWLLSRRWEDEQNENENSTIIVNPVNELKKQEIDSSNRKKEEEANRLSREERKNDNFFQTILNDPSHEMYKQCFSKIPNFAKKACAINKNQPSFEVFMYTQYKKIINEKTL